MANLKLAFRTLFRTPFVTIVAIISLALGIGANAAIFSLFNQMLLRPLPVWQPDRLVNLSAPGPKPGSQSCSQAGDCEDVFSYAMFRDLQQANTGFSGIAAHRAFGANISFDEQTISGAGMLVSGSYFPVLGLKAYRGRLLSPADDRNIGSNFVTVLSYDYWKTSLGADESVVGKPIVLNGQSMMVVGIAPDGFTGTTLGVRPKLFVPISMRGLMEPGFTRFENRRTYWAYLFARLKPDVSMEQAATAVNTVYHPLVSSEASLQQGMSDETMKRFMVKEIELTDGRRGQSSIHTEARTPLIFLFAITATVLLIACANIANLLLARAAGRSMEMAIRLSLGASRAQLLAQLLTESCLLALLGGVVSVVIAQWTIGLIAALLPTSLAVAFNFQLHMSAVWFAAALSMGTGLVFGLFPALHSTRPDLNSTLRSGTGKHSGARAAARFRTSLVTVQIALSMALLMSAGLFVKSLNNVSHVQLGLDVDDVITFGVSPELSGYNRQRSRALFMRVEDELARLPGVTSVAAAMVPLLAGSNWGTDVSVQGFKKGPDTDANARYNEVGPGYLHTVGMQLLAGREFTAADRDGAPQVAIVNEAFAKKFNMGRDVVGKRMSTSGDSALNIEIVGLVRDAKYSEVKDAVPPMFLTPYRQDSTVGAINFYVRTALPAEQLLRTIPPVISRLDPNLPVEGLITMPQQIKENVFMDRMISTLSAAFAVLATLLAAVGLYGVLAYTIAQRTREIGVRMALGANGSHVRRMVLRQVGMMTLIGGIIGIVAAIGLGRAAQSLLFELKGQDPFVIAASAVVLTLVAFGAGYIPALRASRIDPMQALRYE